MLFGFRGIRVFQVFLALVALASGVGAALCLKAFSDGRGLAYIILAVWLGVVFLWAFATALRAPTSFVAVAPERTRIRFAGFIDTVVDNRDILGVSVLRQRPFSGVGVRTNFRGDVSLLSAWGNVAEVTLRTPVRAWLIPGLLPLKATRLRLSIRHPEKLVERFGAPRAASPAPPAARKMRTGRKRAR